MSPVIASNFRRQPDTASRRGPPRQHPRPQESWRIAVPHWYRCSSNLFSATHNGIIVSTQDLAAEFADADAARRRQQRLCSRHANKVLSQQRYNVRRDRRRQQPDASTKSTVAFPALRRSSTARQLSPPPDLSIFPHAALPYSFSLLS